MILVFLFLFLFTAVPVFELYLLFQAGSHIGALNTIAVVLVTGVAGAYLAKSQGLAILHQLQQETQQGRLPGNTILHGFVVLAGGLLLLTPGFMTDAMGFAMVIPGTRHFFVAFLKLWLAKKMAAGQVQFFSGGLGGFRSTWESGGPGGRPQNPSQTSRIEFDARTGRRIRDAKVIEVKDVSED